MGHPCLLIRYVGIWIKIYNEEYMHDVLIMINHASIELMIIDVARLVR